MKFSSQREKIKSTMNQILKSIHEIIGFGPPLVNIGMATEKLFFSTILNMDKIPAFFNLVKNASIELKITSEESIQLQHFIDLLSEIIIQIPVSFDSNGNPASFRWIDKTNDDTDEIIIGMFKDEFDCFEKDVNDYLSTPKWMMTDALNVKERNISSRLFKINKVIDIVRPFRGQWNKKYLTKLLKVMEDAANA
jgi:hypothetical protein